MIQSPALSPVSALPAAGDQPLAALPEGTETTDFGAILALSLPADNAPVVEPEAVSLPKQIPALPGNMPANDGNFLPPALPDAHSFPAKQQVQPEPESRVKPQPQLPSPSILRKPQAKRLTLCTDQPSGGEPLENKAKPEAPPVTAALLSQPPLPQMAPLPVPPVAMQSEVELPDETATQPRPSALAHAAPQAVFLRTPAAPLPVRGKVPLQPAPGPLADVQVPASSQVRIGQPAAAPVAQVRLELEAPAPVGARSLPRDKAAVPRIALSAAEPVPAQLPAPSAVHAQPVPQVTAMPAVPSERPQDFSALIDRLVAAREAVQPQTVAIRVPHADFGEVRLRFRHDDAGLAVSLASADPAFARAASAMPPVLPVSEAQVAQFQSGQGPTRQDGAAASGQSQTGQQQRGPQDERRHSNQPQTNIAPRQAQPGKPQHRSGIFA